MPSDDNVVMLGNVTRLDIPPERVLQAALDKGLKSVVVLGYDEEGEEYFCSSVADGGTVIWLMERAKKQLLEIGDD